MPNWCLNAVNLRHSDAAMISRIVKAINEDRGLFSEFYPIPQKLQEMSAPAPEEYVESNLKEFGACDWYNWAVNNWGTKWDVTNVDYFVSDDGKEISLTFDTAWSPPAEFFGNLKEDHGFYVDALYHEPGMCFAGHWEDGDDYCVEYDFSNPNWDQDMPEEVADFLQNEYENYLMWQEEEKSA